MAAHAGAGVDAQAGFSSGRLPDDQVREMFERIAGLYDPMNTAMTAGLRHRWCRPAVMAVFLGSYRPAMRSNISRPWSSGSRPEEKPACVSTPAPAWAAM